MLNIKLKDVSLNIKWISEIHLTLLWFTSATIVKLRMLCLN